MPLLQPYEKLLGDELLGEELLGEELLGKAYRPGMEQFKRTETETSLGPPYLRSGRSEAIRDLQGMGGQAHGPLE